MKKRVKNGKNCPYTVLPGRRGLLPRISGSDAGGSLPAVAPAPEFLGQTVFFPGARKKRIGRNVAYCRIYPQKTVKTPWGFTAAGFSFSLQNKKINGNTAEGLS
jgi:hypothetical protein